MSERILCLDVSFRNCGYALVSGFGEIIEHGCIHTDSERRDRLHLKRQMGESVAAHNARVQNTLCPDVNRVIEMWQEAKARRDVFDHYAAQVRANDEEGNE